MWGFIAGADIKLGQYVGFREDGKVYPVASFRGSPPTLRAARDAAKDEVVRCESAHACLVGVAARAGDAAKADVLPPASWRDRPPLL